MSRTLTVPGILRCIVMQGQIVRSPVGIVAKAHAPLVGLRKRFHVLDDRRKGDSIGEESSLWWGDISFEPIAAIWETGSDSGHLSQAPPWCSCHSLSQIFPFLWTPKILQDQDRVVMKRE